MKNNLFKKGLFLSLLALILIFSGCDLDSKEDLAISGTWGDDTGSKLVFTNDSYSSYWQGNLGWGGEIVKYENNKLNANETEASDGDYGYIVIKYTGGAGNGKYGVLRWKSLITNGATTSMSYSEGYNNGNYFDSPIAAEEGMTDAASYFSMYSSINKQ